MYKKILFGILFFIIVSNSVNSQWINQFNSNSIRGLNCITFIDSLYGVTGGYSAHIPNQIGKILFTNNSGVNWNFAQLPDSVNNISDIKIINPNIIYSVGSFASNVNKKKSSFNIAYPYTDNSFYINKVGTSSGSVFLKSSDKGATWKAIGNIPGNANHIISISFLNPQYGFANCDVGIQNTNAGMLRTTDGGENWSLLNIPTDIFWLLSIHVIDSLNIFSVGTKFTNLPPNQNFTGVILRTTNGGANWIESMFPDVNGFNSIYFLNNSTGFAVGNGNPTETSRMKGTIYKTSDAGNNWTKINTSLSDTSFLNSVKFLPNGAGIIQGGKYKISPNGEIQNQYIYVLKSSDFGVNWNMSKVATGTISGNQIEIVNDKKFYLCGGASNSQALIYYTSNGGETFINNNSSLIPENFTLHQNYPNPFNPNTVIGYQLKVSGNINLNIYDINGKLIKILESGYKREGSYETTFSGEGLSSGIYYYSLFADGVLMDTKKAILLK